METIQTFSKASLDNALHYSFMSEVLTVAISQDLPDQKALDATTALRTAFMKEDEQRDGEDELKKFYEEYFHF